jgi:chromosome segregation ATPase
MKRKIQELDGANKKLRAEAENKIGMLSQECERLNGVVEKKNSEIRALGGEVQEHQEGLRLSSAQLSKIGAEMNDLKSRLGATAQESETYKLRIQKLIAENSSLNEESRNAQENLRLSTGQIGRLTAEYKAMVAQTEDFKRRIGELEAQNKRLSAEGENKVAILSQECERLNALVEKRNGEIRALGGEVQEHQEGLRLSSAQLSKMGAEVNELRNRLGSTSQESETYKQRIQKLLSENNSLNEETRSAQEALRLSAGQMGKLQNEFKLVCNENEELKRALQ